MRALGKIALVLVVLTLIFAGAWSWAGRAAGPQIQIRQPSKTIGLATPFEIAIDAPRSRLARAEVGLEQNGKTVRLFTLDPAAHQTVRQENADRIIITGV